MKYTILLSTLLLSGCGLFVPVTNKLPELPKELNVACPQLKTIEGESTTLSKLLSTVTDNYTQYHECAKNNNALIEWYTKQYDIYNKIGD